MKVCLHTADARYFVDLIAELNQISKTPADIFISYDLSETSEARQGTMLQLVPCHMTLDQLLKLFYVTEGFN